MRLVTDARALLRRPAFVRLYATRLVSQAADGMFQASLASAVLFSPDQQASAARLAASFTVVLLPYSLVGPFAGVLLDRWRRQRVLVGGNVARAMIVCLTAAAIAYAGGGSPEVYAAALVAISVSRFYLAALSAGLPHTVGQPDLVTADALATTSGTIVAALGGAAAVAIRGLAGASDHTDGAIALTAAAGYLLAAGLAAKFRPDALGPDTTASASPLRHQLVAVAGELAAGARHVWSRREPRTALGAIAGHRLCYGLSTVATVLVYRGYFTDHGMLRAGLGGLAQMVAATALGGLTAAVVTPRAARRLTSAGWITANLVTAAAAEVVLGVPYRQGTFLAAALVLGFVAQATKICVDATIQRTVDDRYLGRVFSLYDMLFNVTFMAAALLGAAVLPENGKSLTLILAVAGGYALTAAAYRLSGRRDPEPAEALVTEPAV